MSRAHGRAGATIAKDGRNVASAWFCRFSRNSPGAKIPVEPQIPVFLFSLQFLSGDSSADGEVFYAPEALIFRKNPIFS